MQLVIDESHQYFVADLLHNLARLVSTDRVRISNVDWSIEHDQLMQNAPGTDQRVVYTDITFRIVGPVPGDAMPEAALAMTRDFDLGDILSVTTGRLVSTRHMGGVCDILTFMTGDNLFMHQIPRAIRECAPFPARAASAARGRRPHDG